jgi:hypothetical protein
MLKSEIISLHGAKSKIALDLFGFHIKHKLMNTPKTNAKSERRSAVFDVFPLDF